MSNILDRDPSAMTPAELREYDEARADENERLADQHKASAKWYIATYGDMGLDVEFFSDPLAYGRALRRLKCAFDDGRRYPDGFGDLDSYTNGTCEV